jgi:dTDP-4-amino-4,6-dideoxygalactose transaminase
MMNIPMLDLKREYEYMKVEIDTAIRNCLDHQKWIFGPEIKELETKIAEYTGVKHCIGVSSGTEALVLSLRALAVKTKGQEYFDRSDLIITTPFTFTATGDAILRSGATPVFVDIDPATYNIDPARIREFLTSHISRLTSDVSQVVGLIPVHLYGMSCEMDEIMKIANEHNLFVVEDVAQAFGGKWHCSSDLSNKQIDYSTSQPLNQSSKMLGSLGAAGCFSFFPSKNLGGFGDGGMVSTNDDEIDELVRMLLKHGGKDKYNVDHIGYNARLDTLQAAVLLAKFKYIDELNDYRRRIAEIYTRELSDVEGLVLPFALSPSLFAGSGHVFHQYTVRVLNGKRGEFQKFLKDEGVSSMVYYPVPLHEMKVFDGRSNSLGELPEAEKAVNEVLSLPMEPLMAEEEVKAVAETAKRFFAS